MGKIDLRNRAPSVNYLPDGRQRTERTYDVLNFAVFTQAEINADVWLPWGTADDTYPLCRLIKQDVTGQHPSGGGMRGDPTVSPERHPPILNRIYEQLDPSLETPVGQADVTVDQDGTTTVVDESIQFSTGTAVYGVPGVTTAPAPWGTLVLKFESRTDDGELRHIKRTYISKGLISQSDEFRNFGALQIRTLVYVNLVPPTPAGFTLIDKDVKYPNGLPLYTYKFATGLGLIDVRYQQREGGLRIVTYLSLGTSFIPAIMQPPGVLVAQDQEYVDGMYKFMASSMQSAAGGSLLTGTSVLVYNVKHPFRYPGRAKAFHVALTANYAQFETPNYVNYPYSAHTYDLYKSPPVDTLVDAQVAVSYQPSPVLVLGTSFWNPTTWATMDALYQQYNQFIPTREVEVLTGYRAINAGTALAFFVTNQTISGGGIIGTVNVTAISFSCLGKKLQPVTNGYINVYDGPAAPDGQTLILSVNLEPAFTDFSGVQYYRKTQISSVIPAQSALPF